MWALRRTSSIALRSQTFSAVTFRPSFPEHKTPFSTYTDKTRFHNPPPRTSGSRILNTYSSSTHSSTTSNHTYSSITGTIINGEKEEEEEEEEEEEDDDNKLEDGFSELEDESDNESISENDTEVMGPKVTKTNQQKRAFSEIFKAIMDSPFQPVQNTLDKWLEKGDSITRSDISIAMLEFRRRKMYGKALHLSEWLQSRKQLQFNEKDYSSHVDLISKVHGLQAAEKYISKIPKSFQGELVYRTLLANCVITTDTTKAEQIFNKMKELKFPITPFVCNQLLLLYKRTNKKKIPDVLKLMEDENVKPTLFTYTMLIDIKGQSNDIDGIDKIIEIMKAEDIDMDPKTRAILARHYINFGLKEKAITVLKEMEESNLQENQWICAYLLPLYADLGSLEEVNRIWSIRKSNPMVNDCVNAIYAFGKLNKVDQAETVFDQMTKRFKRISSRHFAVMLKVYANNKMLEKGKDLVKRMAEIGCAIGPLTWDALVKLYVESGEVEKADSILRRASEQNRVKPFFNSYMVVMDGYAKKGDVHNAEKMFYRMRQDGYVSRVRQFHVLLKSYVVAKVPAYGFRERMKADNVFPTKSLAGQLAQVDPFKRSLVSNILD